jgi:hypothetical protein
MCVLKKGFNVRFKFSIIMIMAIAVLLTATLTGDARAQQSKAKLVQITLNDENTDKKAEKIIRTLYADWMKTHKKRGKLGDIKARFIPLQKEGSSDKFIFTVLYDEPFGGCFARGCKTIIMHSKNSKEWKGVFGAFVHNTYYDVSSRETKHANLILSSHLNNKDLGVWMWDGSRYELVNKK